MKFKYQAKTKDGTTQVGIVEASDRDSASAILAGHDLFVLSVVAERAPNMFDNIAGFFSRVRRKELIVFARQLATLLEARLPLNNALKILYEQTTSPTLKTAISQMTEDIDAGVSFSQALERQNRVFPDYYIELVRAAEVTGNLNEVAAFLADYTEKEGDLASKASSALVYPGIVIALFIVVAFILVTFVYPSLGGVFAENGVALPWYTQILLNTGNFLHKWWIAVVVAAVAVAGLAVNYFQTAEGEAILDEAKIRLPIVKKVYLPVIMARFGNSAALLVHGGIPIAQALEIIGHMVGNVLYRDVVHDIAEDVRQGSLLSQSIAKYPQYFPALIPQMVAVGETTGKVEEMFNRLSGIYTREADEITNNLVDLIQPVLMIGIGVMVGLLFASILIPIYNLTDSIH
ncbi:MAG TPA: type II secretion system F family protein [Candidatus Paceibacterota bacterium]|nr:type II secretion system F family protein [Candidatus Paceibacterota bacterium]